MSNSKLVNYTKLSPNHSGKRTHSIDRITPHCVVGQCSVETLGNIFQDTAREASCNYGIAMTAECYSVSMRATALGVVHQTQMTSVQLQSNVQATQ